MNNSNFKVVTNNQLKNFFTYRKLEDAAKKVQIKDMKKNKKNIFNGSSLYNQALLAIRNAIRCRMRIRNVSSSISNFHMDQYIRHMKNFCRIWASFVESAARGETKTNKD